MKREKVLKMNLKDLSKSELEKVFEDAKPPKISKLKGEYKVTMLTGIPDFEDIKIFYQKNGQVFGHNLAWEKLDWGYFFIEKGVCEKSGLDVAVINYDHPKNSYFTKRIRDHIRCIDEEETIHIGKLNYLIFGKLHFTGYFSLSKK